MRIVVVSDSLRDIPNAVELLSTCGHEVTFVDGLVPFAEIIRQGLAPLQTANAIVMGRVMGTDAAALDLVPRAKVVALHTSGTDNIDLAAATKRGIAVTNVKGVNAAQCAEFSIGLMLAVTRQILAGNEAIRAGRWASDTDSSMDVMGATFGLIGLGQIGREAARRAHAFGMRIICHTRTPDAALAEELGVDFVSLDQLLAEADVVSLYSSLNENTRGMIGADQIARMKSTAYLVNIARGELVDEPALTQALLERRIAGAALDVFDVEPLTQSPLFDLDNVVLTPHMAGLTHRAKLDAAVLAIRNALAILDGSPALNPVNTPADHLKETPT